jgi:multidrug resistance efflux pump
LVRLGNEEQIRDVEETTQKIVELDARLLKAKKGATTEQVAVSRQAVEVAKTRYDFSRRQTERYSSLLRENFISEQSFENMVSQAENDRQSLELAQRNLEELLAGTRSEDIVALQAQLDQARTQLAFHRHQLGITEVRATISGRVVSGTLMYAVGDHLKPEDPILVIEDGKSLLVQISVPGNRYRVITGGRGCTPPRMVDAGNQLQRQDPADRAGSRKGRHRSRCPRLDGIRQQQVEPPVGLDRLC